jgi:sugar/nucleoside kinase (ribokinase family)
VKTVIVVGHVCVDLTPALDAPPGIEPGRLIQVGPLALSAGGCVGNTGLALASLGVPTQLVASVGADELGRALVDLLAASDADTSGISRVDGRGTSYSIVVDVPGRDRTFWHHIGANAAFDGNGVVERVVAAGVANSGDSGDVILHLGYPTHLPALYADGGAGLIRLVSAARSAGAIVSLDMAEIDPKSEATAVDWESILARTLPAVDVVKASVDDLEAMLPGRAGVGAGASIAPIAWADALVDFGAAVALVTAGADGLYLRTAPAERIGTAAPPLREALPNWANRELWAASIATHVVTTTGAGDTAAAGFLAGLAHERGPAESASLAAAAAGARILARPIGDAYELAASCAASTAPALERPSGWWIGPDHVYRGPRDKEV